MRTCSHCRRSFAERAQKCPFCGTFLLALFDATNRAPVEPQAPSRRPRIFGGRGGETLVVIARCRSRWEADFVRTLLESEGIVTAQKPGTAGESWGYLPSFSAAIEILVRTEDEEEARNILLSGREEPPGDSATPE